MTTHTPHSSARRAFLQRMGQLGMAGVATPWAVNLAAIGEAAAFQSDGYKALVCIFLYGGNDNGNTLVPYDSAYSEYSTARQTLATPLSALTETVLAALPSGRQYALAPELKPLKALFDAKRLAVQLNVGPLITRTTAQQFRVRSVPLPPKLFSHNDQQSVWQSSQPEGSTQGWGGRLGDLALASSAQNSTFTCISLTGNAVFLAGAQALSYQVSTNGAVAINPLAGMYGSKACGDALRTLITQARTLPMENEYNRVTSRSITSQGTVNSAIGANDLGPFTAGNPLGDQLKMVARLIRGRDTLQTKRQVFMVSMGGFDLHDNLKDKHTELLRRIGLAMSEFQAVIQGMGLADSVTTFTASDFGRTLLSNGDGSDHGWGSHHFVMGGAVKGGAFYGQAPDGALGGAQDVGQGRLAPTTSVDEFACTLARWFGVSASELPTVLPNIDTFGRTGMGFV